MFCMNCGQQLPDGAKFCMNCGTAQGAVSPTQEIVIEKVDRNKESLVQNKVKTDIVSDNKQERNNTFSNLTRRDEESLIHLKVRNEFNFGSYKNAPIKWEVLCIQGIRIKNRKALILSKSILTHLPYHEQGGPITWSNCTLRKWLNNEFLNNSFTQTERARILPTELYNERNPKYKTPGGTPTTDKIFLLSVEQAKTLCSGYYVGGFGNTWVEQRDKHSLWWLRTPGKSTDQACYVGTFKPGIINTDGSYVSNNHGVCPALWLKLD